MSKRAEKNLDKMIAALNLRAAETAAKIRLSELFDPVFEFELRDKRMRTPTPEEARLNSIALIIGEILEHGDHTFMDIVDGLEHFFSGTETRCVLWKLIADQEATIDDKNVVRIAS